MPRKVRHSYCFLLHRLALHKLKGVNELYITKWFKDHVLRPAENCRFILSAKVCLQLIFPGSSFYFFFNPLTFTPNAWFSWCRRRIDNERQIRQDGAQLMASRSRPRLYIVYCNLSSFRAYTFVCQTWQITEVSIILGLMLPTTFLISVASSGPLTQKLTSLLKIGFCNF